MKVYNNISIMGLSERSSIHFKDHSNDFSVDSVRKRKRSIALPNPHYVAIHSALAEILHVSGAGRFFDKLLTGYRDEDGSFPAVRSWSELETLMEKKLLRDSVIHMFQSAHMR